MQTDQFIKLIVFIFVASVIFLDYFEIVNELNNLTAVVKVGAIGRKKFLDFF